MAKYPSILWCLLVVMYSALSASAQDIPARQSFGVTGTFAPNSSHILIGSAEQRRVWTSGIEYGRTLWGNRSVRLDYEASISPFFQERDPTAVGTKTILQGGVIQVASIPPERVVYANKNSIGYLYLIGYNAPIYYIYGSTKTYAAAVAPLGARINGFNSRNIQPTFSVDLGMVFSSRDLPIDNSSNINYQFSFGPGFEYFYHPNKAVRLEYVYRHLSNANSGTYNPGVDAGVFRLTLTTRHK